MNPSTTDIVLVRPAVPENVGMVARAVKAFGFQRLVLTSPQFEWEPDGPACKTACGSKDIVGGVSVFKTLQDAVRECNLVVGFSRREHDFDRPQYDLRDWREEYSQKSVVCRTALVFGPENFGLTNEDKHCCAMMVSIPARCETLSLNLAQAVSIVLYEISLSNIASTASPAVLEPFASSEDVGRVVERLTRLLDRTSFFKEGRRERQIESLRNFVYRQHLTINEYNTIMGIINSL